MTELAPMRSWLACCFVFALLVGGFTANGRILGVEIETGTATTVHKKKTSKSVEQPLPTLHEDESYTILLPDNNNDGIDKPVVVTPMTIVYNYELYDGQMILTNTHKEHIPNFDFDLAILGVTAMRNMYRDTNELVSLDEVYNHHFIIVPIEHLGNVNINKGRDPFMFFPQGYARKILADEHPYFDINAHFMSNKNLSPINGSVDLAKKQCNECYYAPYKKPSCKPQISGTFLCCDHCATTTNARTRTTTKYRMEYDLLVSRDLESFKHVDSWTFNAPYCFGETSPEENLPDGFCSGGMAERYGTNAAFHQLPQQPNEHPYFKSTADIPSAASGTLVWAQGHFHTGIVNATLSLNGKVVCTVTAEHGTNPDPSTNAGNELNHLVSLGSCYDQIPTGGIRFEIRDVFTVESYYYGGTDDPRFSSDLVTGERKNLMSRFYAAVEIDEVATSGVVYEFGAYSINKQPLFKKDFSLDEGGE